MCDNEKCSRRAYFEATYSFETGPRITSDLCEPCKDMLVEGDNAVDIEIEAKP